ncbi:MAG: hypothetical protein R3240_00620 [Gammaproteobacteria bacterium]|nr:hypothetical protein [Gammaproteobacteria bacterium]
MTTIQKENLEKLLNKQRSIKITIGAVGGIILLLFFFSFATLVDKAPAEFYILEAIISVVIFASFFMLNKISFGWVKITKGKKEEFKAIIPLINQNDVDAKLDKVFERISS